MAADNAEIQKMVALIREGKREGFDMLFTGYATALYGVIYRMAGDKAVAENLLEKTLVCICTRIDEYKGTGRFFTWAIQQMQFVCHEYIKREKSLQCKDAMEMVFFAGYTYVEMAGVMNATADMVKTDVRNRLMLYR